MKNVDAKERLGLDARRHWDDLWHGVMHTFNVDDVSYSVDLMKFERLLRILPRKPLRVLEVGCGSARLSCLLARERFETIALDISKEALRVAVANYRLNGVSGRFLCASAERLPFRDEVFDLVVSTGLLEHFSNPSHIVLEMVRVLRPGGFFYSDVVPRKFSLLRALEFLRKRYRSSPIDNVYESSCGRRDIEAWLQGVGLTAIDVFSAGVLPPLLPLIPDRVNRIVARLVYKTRPWWALFDRTRLADWLGFYYFAFAVKPDAPLMSSS